MEMPRERSDETRGAIERLDTAAQWYGMLAGLFLLALGILAVVIEEPSYGTIGPLADQPDLLIWTVSGWTAVLWTAAGAIGVIASNRLDTARAYAVIVGGILAALAVWGFVDGNDVLGVFAAGTGTNVTHAVLGALGLAVGAAPRRVQRPHEQDEAASTGIPAPLRFESPGERRIGTSGRR